MIAESDALVVGGGPAGCATATFLAREGVAVTLLDRARFPRPKPCAEYLSPEAGRTLEALGVLPDVASRATPLFGMEVRAPSGARIVGDYSAEQHYQPFQPHGLALPRLVLDALLLQRARAAGVRVVEGVRVRDLVRDRSGRVCGVHTLDADGRDQKFSARLVVGADGLRSIVARRARLARQLRWPARLAFVAHYRDVTGVGSRGEMLVEGDGYIGIAAVGGGLVNVSLVMDRAAIARGRSARAKSGAEVMDSWIARHPHVAARFARAHRVDDVQATGPFASRARRAWAAGVALVGDAADFFDPFTGEGMHSALLGGEALARLGARALRTGSDAPLREYERWRRAEFTAKWRVEWLIAGAVARPWLLERAASAFAQRPDLAHRLVGVTGDFVPAREVLRGRYLAALVKAALTGDVRPVGDITPA